MLNPNDDAESASAGPPRRKKASKGSSGPTVNTWINNTYLIIIIIHSWQPTQAAKRAAPPPAEPKPTAGVAFDPSNCLASKPQQRFSAAHGRVSALVLTSILALPAILCLCDPFLPARARAGSCCRLCKRSRELIRPRGREKTRENAAGKTGTYLVAKERKGKVSRSPHTTHVSLGLAASSLPLELR